MYYIVESLAGVAEREPVQMLPRQPEPLVHLAFAAVGLDFVLQTKRIGVLGVDFERFLHLLQRQRILLILGIRVRALSSSCASTFFLVAWSILRRKGAISGIRCPSDSSSVRISEANCRSPESKALEARSMRGIILAESNDSMGSLRIAFCRASDNSRAVLKRFQGCLAIVL